MHASVTSPVERRQGRLEDYKQTITERPTTYLDYMYVRGWAGRRKRDAAAPSGTGGSCSTLGSICRAVRDEVDRWMLGRWCPRISHLPRRVVSPVRLPDQGATTPVDGPLIPVSSLMGVPSLNSGPSETTCHVIDLASTPRCVASSLA